MALIKCPECGGTVSDNAVSCPHCGNNLSSISNNYTPSQPPTKKRMSCLTKCLITWGVIVVLGACLLFIDKPDNKSEENQEITNRQYQRVNPWKEIVPVYNNNMARAEDQWVGKYVEIDGYVSNIQKEYLGLCENLNANELSDWFVSCSVPDKFNDMLLKLNKGTHVTIKGKLTGLNPTESFDVSVDDIIIK